MPYRTNGISITTLPYRITIDSIFCWMKQNVEKGNVVSTGTPDTIIVENCLFIGRKSKICDLKPNKKYYMNDSFGSYFNDEKGIWIAFWGVSAQAVTTKFHLKVK